MTDCLVYQFVCKDGACDHNSSVGETHVTCNVLCNQISFSSN